MAAEPARVRYEILTRYSGMDRFAWAIIVGLVAIVIFGGLTLKIVAAAGLALSLAGMAAQRLRPQFVELDKHSLRLRMGYGPALTVDYADVEGVGEAAPGGLPLRPRWPWEMAEVRLRRRKLVFVLVPLPLVWLSRRLRFPLAEPEAFIADLRGRLAVDASAHSF